MSCWYESAEDAKKAEAVLRKRDQERDAFRAGWIDYHMGRSGSPRDRAYARGALLNTWQDGWLRAVREQDSRHFEQQGGSYVYVQMPRHPWVADLTAAQSSGFGNWAR